MSKQGRLRVLAPQSLLAEGPQISRRLMLGGALGVGAAALAGCGRNTSIAETAKPDGKLEDRLNVYSWGDYEAPETIKDFQREFDVRVQIDAFTANEEMIAKLGASRGTSGYDIVVPSSQFVPLMVANKLLVRLDHSLLPNMKHLEPEFIDPEYDQGNRYTVPKSWGTTGYLYDKTKIDGDPTSWQDFMDLAAGPAKGSVNLLDDPFEIHTIYFGAKGIDLNTTNREELAAARKYLVEDLGPQVRAYNSTPTQSVIQAEMALLQMYNGDARLALLESSNMDRWGFVYPTPTANRWIDTWTIAAGAQHVDAAHAFINNMMKPAVATQELDWNGYPTGTAGLEERAKKLELERLDLIFPGSEVIDRLTPAVITDAQEYLTDTVQRMRAGVS